MDNAVEYVKKHPLVIGGIVAGGVVLYLLYASGGGTTLVSTGPDASQQQLSAQLDAHSQDLQTQLQLAQITASANYGIAQLSLANNEYTADANKEISLAGIGASQTVQLAGLQSQTQIASLAQQTNQLQIAAARDAALATNAVYSHLADVNANSAIEQARIGSATSIAQANFNYQTAAASFAAQIAINAQIQKTNRAQIKASSGGGFGISDFLDIAKFAASFA